MQAVADPACAHAHHVPMLQVSGRKWKAPAQRAGNIMKAKSNADWEKKQQLAAQRKMFLEHKKEAVDAAKAKRKVCVS